MWYQLVVFHSLSQFFRVSTVAVKKLTSLCKVVFWISSYRKCPDYSCAVISDTFFLSSIVQKGRQLRAFLCTWQFPLTMYNLYPINFICLIKLVNHILTLLEMLHISRRDAFCSWMERDCNPGWGDSPCSPLCWGHAVSTSFRPPWREAPLALQAQPTHLD